MHVDSTIKITTSRGLIEEVFIFLFLSFDQKIEEVEGEEFDEEAVRGSGLG